MPRPPENTVSVSSLSGKEATVRSGTKKKNTLLWLTLTMILLPAPAAVQAQAKVFTQTVRGKVTDRDTRSGLPNASVVLLNSDPLKGTSTDLEGNFILKDVPVGSQSISVSYTGYQTVVLPDVLVST